MVRRRFRTALTIAVVSLGLATTSFWLLNSGESFSLLSRELPLLTLVLIEIAILTTFNMAIRWLRWHFLLRRSKVHAKTKESLGIWMLSLPGIATPFYVGELVRAPLLARRFRTPFWIVLGIWSIERLADVYVLGFSVLAVRGHWSVLLGIGVVTALCVWVLRLVPHAQVVRTITHPFEMTVVVGSTLLAWALPALGLWILLLQLGTPLPARDVVEAFGVGTLLGGFSGVPLGVGVTGSAMILSLQAKGVPAEIATIGIALFRAGTAYYAIGIGLVALALARGFILPLLGAQPRRGHFDQIAEVYGENIPPHMVERLLLRKTDTMHAWLSEAAAQDGRRGLDVGCGQGWYVSEMAERGYRMNAMDLSIRQIQQAREHLAETGMVLPLCVADVAALPYADGSFDFAFSVNVIHHIARSQNRQAAFHEILRVLRPGGHFFLQEINIRNPLFRFYMGYVFPLLKDIDEGTEQWLVPEAPPDVQGGRWKTEVVYFNFLPDFTPAPVMKWLTGVESYLERSRLRRWSSHYVACLTKTDPLAEPLSRPQGTPGPQV